MPPADVHTHTGFIADTGIATQRDAVKEKEDQQSLKQKTRERVQPKMGKIDIDYQKLHDAFFRYQTKPKMTEFGEVCVRPFLSVVLVPLFADQERELMLYILPRAATTRARSTRPSSRRSGRATCRTSSRTPCRSRRSRRRRGSSACSATARRRATRTCASPVSTRPSLKGASLSLLSSLPPLEAAR